ncbi:MAG: hypothetical protein JW388_1338 [Nitrospira sp.]|nr:hypothetical protein [Nitrospira sp.]
MAGGLPRVIGNQRIPFLQTVNRVVGHNIIFNTIGHRVDMTWRSRHRLGHHIAIPIKHTSR